MPAPPLYVRRATFSSGDSSDAPQDEPLLVSDLSETPIEPGMMVATSMQGRFVGIGDAIDHAPDVREALLALDKDPKLERWRRFRAIALAAPVSWGMVVASNAKEVSDLARDAEKVVNSPAFKAAENDPDTAQLAKTRHQRIDRAVTMRKVYVAVEGAIGLAGLLVVLVGARRYRSILVALGAGAAAWWLFHAGSGGRCFGGGAWRDLALALFGVVGAISALVLAPTETTVARDLRTRLGLPPREDGGDAHSRRKDIAALIAAAWAGLSLPFMLDLLRRVHIDDRFRAAVFVLFCLAAFLGLLVWRKDLTKVPPSVQAIALVAVLGFGITTAADIASRATLGAIVEVQTCVAPESAKKLRAVQDQSGKETTAARKDTQTDSFAWFIAVLAAPLSEEMLYRGALQRVARRRLGSRLAILLSATIFGLAHSFAFQHAFYQHIGLGLAFAAVFELAGGGAVAVVACAATHALWNLWLASMPVF